MRAIALGFACNNACVFCALGDGDARGPAEIDPAGAIASVAPGEAVAFQGGEPTLLAGLCGWIQAADGRGAARIVLQTNGRRLAYRAYARALREASAKLVLDVSLHGATAPMHEYHTGVPGSFAQTVQGLRNARAEGIPAGVTTVVTRSSFRHLAEIVRVAHAAGAQAVHFAPAEPAGRAAANKPKVMPSSEMVLPHLQRAVAEAQRLGLGVQVGDRPVPGTASAFFAGIGEVRRPPAGGAPAAGGPGHSAARPRGAPDGERVALPVLRGGTDDGGREPE
jgi:MoaA/NifB/PqqE/SkfB family radical SAM enzyme